MLRALTLGVVILGTAFAAEKPLNLILIMADDLGYETIGANGGESYETPNLDRVAAEGIRFEHCYSQSICTPSRVQIMTGKYNDRNYTKFGELKRGELTFGHLFQKKGYKTCIAGKWQLGKEKDSPQHFGFDESLLWQHTRGRTKQGEKFDSRFSNPCLERNGVEENYTSGEFGPDLCADFVCEFIDENKDRPFLVYYPMILTHCPFIPVPGSPDWDPKDPGSPTYKGDAKFFGGMVHYMDRIVGRIEKQVEQSGVADHTVIIFTGDNGTDKPVVSMWKGMKYPGGKGSTTNFGNHVPLIVHAPGLEGRGVCRDLVDFTDMLPTICDLAKIDLSKVEESLDGRSFAPQLRGEEGNPRDHVFAWYSPKGGTGKGLSVWARTDRYKLYKSGKFYDLANDLREKKPIKPDELTDEQLAIKARLRKVIDDRLEQVGR